MRAVTAMPNRILSISYDGPLLVTRQMLLQAYGYDVTSAEGFAEALEHCEGEPVFDLVVIGHSIPFKDKRRIISEIRKGRPIPVLALLRPGERGRSTRPMSRLNRTTPGYSLTRSND
jgi:CheY-like chemotaxis protein